MRLVKGKTDRDNLVHYLSSIKGNTNLNVRAFVAQNIRHKVFRTITAVQMLVYRRTLPSKL